MDFEILILSGDFYVQDDNQALISNLSETPYISLSSLCVGKKKQSLTEKYISSFDIINGYSTRINKNILMFIYSSSGGVVECKT